MFVKNARLLPSINKSPGPLTMLELLLLTISNPLKSVFTIKLEISTNIAMLSPDRSFEFRILMI